MRTALAVMLCLILAGCGGARDEHTNTAAACQAHGMKPVGVTWEQDNAEYVCYTESPCKFYAYDAEAEDRRIP